jgi:hypothetical protein
VLPDPRLSSYPHGELLVAYGLELVDVGVAGGLGMWTTGCLFTGKRDSGDGLILWSCGWRGADDEES